MICLRKIVIIHPSDLLRISATMFSMQRVFFLPLQSYLFLQGQRIHQYSRKNH